MLTTSEKRFVRYWQEQRAGGKRTYLVLYMVVGWFISTLIASVFLFLFFQVVFGSLTFFILAACTLLLATAIAVYSWKVNEKKFRLIIRREVEQGKASDQLQ